MFSYLTSMHVYFFTFFLGRKLDYFGHLEGFFDPWECLESLRGVSEINFAGRVVPNGLTATRLSKKIFVFRSYELRLDPRGASPRRSREPRHRLQVLGIKDNYYNYSYD